VDKGVDDFRNKKLFDSGSPSPNKEIEMHDNGKTYAFQKIGEDGSRTARRWTAPALQSFLDKFRDLSPASLSIPVSRRRPPISRLTSNDGKRIERY